MESVQEADKHVIFKKGVNKCTNRCTVISVYKTEAVIYNIVEYGSV